jgi:hypothetical protein
VGDAPVLALLSRNGMECRMSAAGSHIWLLHPLLSAPTTPSEASPKSIIGRFCPRFLGTYNMSKRVLLLWNWNTGACEGVDNHTCEVQC